MTTGQKTRTFNSCAVQILACFLCGHKKHAFVWNGRTDLYFEMQQHFLHPHPTPTPSITLCCQGQYFYRYSNKANILCLCAPFLSFYCIPLPFQVSHASPSRSWTPTAVPFRSQLRTVPDCRGQRVAPPHFIPTVLMSWPQWVKCTPSTTAQVRVDTRQGPLDRINVVWGSDWWHERRFSEWKSCV